MPNTERLTVPVNGAAIRFVRRGLGITPARLAAEADISVGYVRQIELGHTRGVGRDVYDAICKALRVDDRRVLMAHPYEYEAPRHPSAPPDPIDAPDPIDDALDAPDPVDDALDAPDPADTIDTTESVAS